MGKNIRGGKKHKKSKNNIQQERILMFKEGRSEFYGKVVRKLGGPILLVLIEYNNEVIEKKCKIRGKMRKRVWINPGDWILTSKRETNEDDNFDVIYKYRENEVRELHKLKEININMSLEDNDKCKKNESEILFEDVISFDDI